MYSSKSQPHLMPKVVLVTAALPLCLVEVLMRDNPAAAPMIGVDVLEEATHLFQLLGVSEPHCLV